MQYMNTFMSPYSDMSAPPKPNILTEDRPEAKILANLGGLAIQKPSCGPSKVVPSMDFLQTTPSVGTGTEGTLSPDDLSFFDSLFSDSNTYTPSGSIGDFFTTSVDASFLGTTQPAQWVNQPLLTGSAPAGTTGFSTTNGAGNLKSAQFIPRIIERADSHQPRSPFTTNLPMQRGESNEPFDYDNYPAMLDECAKELGAGISARDLYKLLADIFAAPRSVYLMLYMEVIWYLLIHNALPPSCVYTIICGNLRGAVLSGETILSLPPDLEEACYACAIGEIGQLKTSSSPMFAITAIFLAMHDFQSGRYPEMMEHINLAHDTMLRCKIKGYSYPWRDVADEVAQSSVFDFCITTFWHTYALRNIFSLLMMPHTPADNGTLPVSSSKTSSLDELNMAVDIDMTEVLPENFRSTNPMAPATLVFRGNDDKDFIASRPPNSPTTHLEVSLLPYLQSLAKHYTDHLHAYSLLAGGKIGLKQYVRFCRAQKVSLQRTKYTLPESTKLTQEKVVEYLQMIKPGSNVPHEHISTRARHLKELIALYIMFQVLRSRVCRSVLKKMLGEDLNSLPPDISTQAFSIRDMYDLPSASSFDQLELARMNEYFLSVRSQALDSANVLANLLQIAYTCKFNLYCLGPLVIFGIEELLIAHVSMAKHTNHYIRWNSHKRLANILEMLRTLRYWSPALNLFVAGVQALSGQDCCINTPCNKEKFHDDLGVKAARVEVTRRSSYPRPLRSPMPTVLSDETANYAAVEKIPEFPNPYPPNHIISIIIKELGVSLAEFLAPAYPILLLKLLHTSKP
ncbi:hypothetical protein FBU59_001482 [Linderina macrospora]|uniref:Uncharacterized protein n=1 Tax=Linderina macrospora TaxID=4868 RepID=A0ACC1JDW5_9FUNG|nr:hypothetical protein FBU59_001482 [Linderina macrospora]